MMPAPNLQLEQYYSLHGTDCSWTWGGGGEQRLQQQSHIPLFMASLRSLHFPKYYLLLNNQQNSRWHQTTLQAFLIARHHGTEPQWGQALPR